MGSCSLFLRWYKITQSNYSWRIVYHAKNLSDTECHSLAEQVVSILKSNATKIERTEIPQIGEEPLEFTYEGCTIGLFRSPEEKAVATVKTVAGKIALQLEAEEVARMAATQ